MPPEIALLYSPRLVVRTERYLPSGILGSSLLSPALLARYRTSESEVTGFVVIFCSQQRARDAFVSYKKFRALKGEIAETPGKISEEGYTVMDKYHGRIILCFYKKYIFGIYDIRTDVQERDARSIVRHSRGAEVRCSNTAKGRSFSEKLCALVNRNRGRDI